MAIDFSLLQPQPTPHQGVVAQSGPSPLESLGAGLMTGAKTITDIRAARQNMAVQQQQMDQNKQLFPSVLQKSQNDAESSTLDLQQKKSNIKSVQEVSDAFHKNWDAGMAQMAKSDPGGYVKLQGDIATTQKTLQDTANLATTNKKDALGMYNDFAAKGYSLAQASANAEHQQPGSGDVVYQQGLKMLGSTVAAQLPPHFDANTFHTLTYIGADSKLQQMKDAEGKNATPEMKNAQAIGDLQDKAQNKTITPAEQGKLDSLQMQINGKINKDKGGKDPDEIYQTSLSEGLGKADAKTVTTAQTTRGTMTHLLADTQDASNILTKIPPGYTGPIVDYLKANKMDTEVQEMQKITAEIPFLTKSLVGISNGMRFTQGELEQLNRASGSTAINREALQWVIDRTSTKSIEGIHNNWEVESNIRKNGGKEAYSRWLETNPEPSKSIDKSNSYQNADTVQVTHPDGRTGTIPKANLDAAIKAGYKPVGAK